jgi:hypothetical protein
LYPHVPPAKNKQNENKKGKDEKMQQASTFS